MLRVGLDFDNTMACYDHVFASIAIKEGWVADNWMGEKQKLKNYMFAQQNGETNWQRLQGQVYGPLMSQAELFPGVIQFMLRCKYRDVQLFIISHKTEYGHFDTTETPLRKSALEWMEEKSFFDKSKFGLRKDHVFFENTREEKVCRIANLNLDVFIDDLKEVFAENNFPKIKKILFTTDTDEKQDLIRCNNWSTIGNEVLGPITDDDSIELAQTILNENISKVHKIQGRGNSRIYQIETKKHQAYALKYYPDLLLDTRNRLHTEIQACKILEDFHLTPKIVAFDKELNIAIYEWISGEVLQDIEEEHIDQALDFIEFLQKFDVSCFSQSASESCVSAEQLFSQIEKRFQKLQIINNQQLKYFLNNIFKPLYQEVKHWSHQQWPTDNLQEILPHDKQILSPSDFGFHNSILRGDGSLCFLDLEYFGWDDPVKLIADFIWHPAMDLAAGHKNRWLASSLKLFENHGEVQQRFRAAWPLYGLRWAMILLNEFRKDGWEKKIHVDEELKNFRQQKFNEQINKAIAICDLIKLHKMEYLNA
jgi:hypothetical protein